MKDKQLQAPCTYQGAKKRIREEIVNIILENTKVDKGTSIYDLCCGTGNITLEFLSRGVPANNITMVDVCSWGAFWKLMSSPNVDLNKFDTYLNNIPKDKKFIQGYLKTLSMEDANIDEGYKYLLLQAGAFGGKQVYKEGSMWKNNSFRSYWQPTETSIRRSPVNPLQPMTETIKDRLLTLVKPCKGLHVLHMDIIEAWNILKKNVSQNSIIYIDPPYIGTTGYGFDFDWRGLVKLIKGDFPYLPVYISECNKYSNKAIQLNFSGAKGGISGTRSKKQEEWLNIY